MNGESCSNDELGLTIQIYSVAKLVETGMPVRSTIGT